MESMFVNAVASASKAMFPIFRITPLPNNQVNVAICGSAFFINNEGHFVTVAHIFDGSNEETKYIFAGLLPDQIENPQLVVTEVARDDQHDIYLGKIDKQTEAIPFFKELVPVGKTVCIGGYPLAELKSNAGGGLDASGVRRYFQPSFVLDHGRSTTTNEAGLTRLHDGFLMRDAGLFGMSGGPVFDTEGRVVGVQAAVTKPRVSQSGTRTISVENAIAIRSNKIAEFITSQGVRF
jgi:S1-C subfamily serine protease